MWLTFATFVGYAVIYTVILKPLTPQNIVIGGASGAMPPVLGWAAMRGDVGPEALILFLIIFLWTPPHFWALALYRVEDYRKSGLPMLPVTHGNEFTRLQILLYTLVLFAALPDALRLWHELLAVPGGGAGAERGFIGYGLRLWRDYSDALARKTFRFSLIHLSAAVRGAAGGPLPETIPVMNRRHLLVLAAAALVSSGCDQVKSMFGAGKVPFKAVDITGADYAGDFPLPDQDGQPAHAEGVQGQGGGGVLRLHPVPRRLPHHAGRAGAGQEARSGPTATSCRACSSPSIRSATRRRCSRPTWATSTPSFVALRGTPEQTAAVAKEFKVFYKKSPGKTPDSYTMDHSAGIFVFDTQGRIRLFSRYGTGPQPLAADMRQLLQAG